MDGNFVSINVVKHPNFDLEAQQSTVNRTARQHHHNDAAAAAAAAGDDDEYSFGCRSLTQTDWVRVSRVIRVSLIPGLTLSVHRYDLYNP